MAARDPVSTDAVELPGADELEDDGTRHSDDGGCPPLVYLTGLTDDDTGSSVLKIGKGGANGDALRIEYADLAGLAVNDTITILITAIHQIDDGMDLLAYIDSNSVTATGRINLDAPMTIGANLYTITQAFIDELGDVGSGNFAVRWGPRAQEAGDCSTAEVDADLTASAAAALDEEAGGVFPPPRIGPDVVAVFS